MMNIHKACMMLQEDLLFLKYLYITNSIIHELAYVNTQQPGTALRKPTLFSEITTNGIES